jgi:hypothetical protein
MKTWELISIVLSALTAGMFHGSWIALSRSMKTYLFLKSPGNHPSLDFLYCQETHMLIHPVARFASVALRVALYFWPA